MTHSLKDIKFPKTYSYSSDSQHVPFEFYNQAFSCSKRIDLFLGYFNSYTFSILSESFAEFIYNGGSMRIITNHFYSPLDKENLLNDDGADYLNDISDILGNLKKLKEALDTKGKLFFDCLKYLKRNGRLQFQPVYFGDGNLSHKKAMLFYDSQDAILTMGSMNFTPSGIVKNGESFNVDVPWMNKLFEERVSEQIALFDDVFNRKHPSYKYLDNKDIEELIDDYGENKSLEELIAATIEENERKDYEYSERIKTIKKNKAIEFRDLLIKIENEPKFPFDEGPREYQKEAYGKWEENNYNGVFAMATGTGKTITSLNCVLNEYSKDGFYRVIILVPSIALLNQWEEEVVSFKFRNILKIGGGNNWEKDLANYVSNFEWGLKKDLIIISTYGSFVLDRFHKYFKKIQEHFTLIADEAHNMGANNVKATLKNINISKKIGLSATPKRIYDLEGTEAIDSFFNDEPPYTYNFGMEKALEFGFLTNYKYYPKIVELAEDEFEEYMELSKRLLQYFDFEKGVFKDDPIVEMLLLKRKSIIHKAKNKIETFTEIIDELITNEKCRYVFSYIPEGFRINEKGEKEKIMNLFIEETHNKFPQIKMNSYTSEGQELNEILKGFTEGKIDILFAMKMLDEGVDVPRAEIGIFASSTGNPRQFIQRRGRLLRKHRDKVFATIYDMVVIPKLSTSIGEMYNMERNLVKNELNRVGYFASLSTNFYDSKDLLNDVCQKYDLDLDTIINEL